MRSVRVRDTDKGDHNTKTSPNGPRINPFHTIERGGSGPAGGAAASEEDITTMTQFLSHLKVTAILQHPMRRHTYVLGSTIGG